MTRPLPAVSQTTLDLDHLPAQTLTPEGASEADRTWPCQTPWRWAGVRVGWFGTEPVYSGSQNATLVLGPPRSGKTTGIVAAAVADAPGPVVSTSTKTDLLELTLPWRKAKGRAWLFDPSGTTVAPAGVTAARWSPLVGCADWSTAVARAHALAGAAATTDGEHAHWIERAEALLAPLLHAGAVAGLDLAWVLRWVLRREITEPLRALARARADEIAGDTLQGIAETDERERSGIFSTAARLLAAYRTPAALAAASEPNFDPHQFVHSSDTLYLVAPSHAQNQLAPIVICLLDQIRHHTYQRHRSWPPTLFALDEAANIAPLPDLPAILAEGAGQGLLTLTCLQDLNQARHRWGRQADGFLTLHGIKVALGGIADHDTLRALSYLAGQQEQAWRTRNTTYTGLLTSHTGWSETIQQRPRIPPERINTLPPGHAYLAHTFHPPALVTLHPPTPTPRPQAWTWARVKTLIHQWLNPSSARSNR